ELHGLVKPAWIQAREGSNLVEPVAECVAVDREAVCSGGRAAVLGEEGVEGLEQLGLVVERAEQVCREVDLGPLVGDADESCDPKAVKAVDLIVAMEATAQGESRACVLV